MHIENGLFLLLRSYFYSESTNISEKIISLASAEMCRAKHNKSSESQK